MKIIGRVGRVEVGVDDGDGEASGMHDACKLKHGVKVALEGKWEEHQSSTLSLLPWGFYWLLH